MALPCLIAYALSYWMQGAARNMSMRWVFSTFIFVGMTLAYMPAASLSFVSVTLSELSSASNAMRSEVNYLCIHLAESDARTANLYDEVLDGYTMEQSGTVMVLVDNRVAGTDDERITQGVDVGKLFDPGVVEAIQQSVRTGTMQRFIYSGILTTSGIPRIPQCRCHRPLCLYESSKRGWRGLLRLL